MGAVIASENPTGLPHPLDEDDDTSVAELLEDLMKQIVDEPLDLRIVETTSQDDNDCQMRIICSPNDVGKVIGRNKILVQAIWTILVSITRGERKILVTVADTTGHVHYLSVPLHPRGRRSNNRRAPQAVEQKGE